MGLVTLYGLVVPDRMDLEKRQAGSYRDGDIFKSSVKAYRECNVSEGAEKET